MRWLTKPLGTPTTLHPLLRTPSLLRTPALTWDVGHPPHALRAGVPIGMAVIGFAEPATSPPIAHMRILVPIPGLDGAHWNTDVWPTGSPYTSSRAVPPSPSFSFTGSPSAFARTLSSSPYRLGMHAPVVRSGDVLQALYTLLQRGASETDFMALDPARRDRVSKAFYVRCRVLGAAAAAAGSGREEEETGREIQRGVKRIDFMEGKTR
ncbi:hypothetical protein K439DRAFT_1634748 [Ramaria rubella]|nr:hypothetical protein K439DRAFT_1634748 [Ramaria rubella]